MDKAHVVDSKGNFSDQIDVVVFDRQYSPFIFHFNSQKIIPAESVYAVFEAKQSISGENIKYAQQKMKTVRCLYRTSLPIPYAKGTYPPKPLIPIIGGILTFESDWTPPLGEPLKKALNGGNAEEHLDVGCIASHGNFRFDSKTGNIDINDGGKPATVFLFQLISQLQFSGTVPMIDINEYAKWLA